jgi:myo-inositol catabolism protein IolC
MFCSSPVRSMAIVKYDRRGRRSETEIIPQPDWSTVERAVAEMDDYCRPVVALSLRPVEGSEEVFEDDDAFNVVGGCGRYALSTMNGDWQYSDPNGKDEEVKLWSSDLGYYCQQRNVLTDLSKALRIVRRFYETGSYADLDDPA